MKRGNAGRSAGAEQVPVKLKVDAALKREWLGALKVLERATKQGYESWDERYEAIARIVGHDPPLYLAAGCATMEQFVERFVHEDLRSVRSWLEVATRATPAEEARYTPTRMALLLGLLRAQSKDGTLPAKVRWDALEVPVQKGGKTVTRSGLEATLEELRAARAVALAKRTKKAPAGAAQAAALQGALGGKALEGVKVRYRDGSFDFRAVPGYALKDFARALLGVEWEQTPGAGAEPPEVGRAKKRTPKKRAPKKK